MANQANPIEASAVWHCDELGSKEKVVKEVISAMGLETLCPCIEKCKITAYPGKFVGEDGPEMILLCIQFDKKNTVVVVYQKKENAYQLFSTIGRFYEIKKVEFILEPESKRTLILLTEYVNMKLGAYEENIFLKGYFWDDVAFGLVLNICTHLKAYWNTAWTSTGKEKKWERVSLDSDCQWLMQETLTVRQYETQDYAISNQKDSLFLPDYSTFLSIQNRFVLEAYYWNTHWGRFILYEGIYNKTKEKVAVIQDISQSPYSLVEGSVEKCIILTNKQETLLVSQKEIDLLT